MGKHKKRYRYTKQEFISICCNKCKLCDKGTSPDLCYSELYALQPKRFIKTVFKNLLEIRKFIDKNGYLQSHTKNNNYSKYLEYLFINAFCNTNLCGKYNSAVTCENITSCMAAFRHQTKGYNLYTSVIDNRKSKSTVDKKKKKHKDRYVAKAYPTFFTNDNADFLEEINTIIYGNSQIEDDKIITQNENNNK